jgi:CheY-like chemotaxis protein
VVIDDDIRNIFSLASALEEYGIELSYAESGRAGPRSARCEAEVDVVLVDIMMPDMDGYETIREIRSRPGMADLPIVAVTAKAMKGDRQKCIQAGASTMSPSRWTSTTWSRCCGSRSSAPTP